MVEAATRDTSLPARPASLVAELRSRNRTLAATTAVMLVVLAGSLIGLVVDPRTVHGNPVWLKPTKFAAAIAVVTAAFGWLTPHFPVSKRVTKRTTTVVGAGSILEIVLIAGQSMRGVDSHFNTATALDTAIFAVMGVTIVVVVSFVAWLLAHAWRGDFDVSPAFAWGIRLGVLLFVVGSFQGGTMNALSGSVTGSGPTLPFLTWNLGGDLRIAHFVGLHALEILPLSGYLATVAAERGHIDRPVLAVWSVALGVSAVFVAALAHALLPVLG